MKARFLSARWLLVLVVLLLPSFAMADACQDIEAVIAKVRNLEELRKQGQALKLSSRQLRACRAKLSSNSKLRQLLDGARQQAARVSQSRQRTTQRRLKRPEQLTINRRALQLRSEATQQLTRLQRTQPRLTKPTTRKPINKPPSAPKITQVTPATLVPGTDVVIEGENFGGTNGSVTLKMQGQSFTAVINAWNDTWINAYLDVDIGGVQATDNAVISVQPQQAAAINHNIPFIPLYVQKTVSEEYGSPGSLIFPGEGATTVFLGKHLDNGWRVTDFAVYADANYGECELGTPSMSVGGERVESQLLWSYDWWEGFAWCYVNVFAEGPQGTSGGL